MRIAQILLVLLVATPSAALADVYRCKDAAGKVTFSDRPCAADAEVIKKSTRPAAPAGEVKRLDVGEATEEQAQACLAHYREYFKDPRSVYVERRVIQEVASPSSADKARHEVFLDARAKNGFGGYVHSGLRCGVTDDGEIDPERTQALVILWRLGVKP